MVRHAHASAQKHTHTKHSGPHTAVITTDPKERVVLGSMAGKIII